MISLKIRSGCLSPSSAEFSESSRMAISHLFGQAISVLDYSLCRTFWMFNQHFLYCSLWMLPRSFPAHLLEVWLLLCSRVLGSGRQQLDPFLSCCLLQGNQTQLPKVVLHIICSSLLVIFCSWWVPCWLLPVHQNFSCTQDTVFRKQLNESWTEGNKHFPQPAGYTFANAVQYAVSLHYIKSALLIHVHTVVYQNLQVRKICSLAQ